MSARIRTAGEEGIALVTTIVVVAIMLVLGTALFGIVLTQTGQTRTERVGDSAFNLAEAALNADAFLLGRNWPQAASAPLCGTPAQTLSGTLATPADTTTLSGQVRSVLAQTYTGGDVTAASRWWVNTCAEGGRNAWDDSLLNGLAYDTSTLPGPRRLWVRAEAEVGGRRRAVVGLVQAGQSPVFPPNLAVVTGAMGADITSTLGTLTGEALAGPLLTNIVAPTGTNQPVISGTVGLRCSLLDGDLSTLLSGDGCLSALFKTTSGLPAPLNRLLQSNRYVDFRSDTTISADQLATLREQAQASGTYFPKATYAAGAVGAAGGPCLPSGSAGKVVFIERVGDGTGSCVLNVTTSAPRAPRRWSSARAASGSPAAARSPA